MLSNLYFFIGLIIAFIQLLIIGNYRKYDAFKQRGVNEPDFKFDKYTTNQKTYSLFQVFVFLPWWLLSFLTGQWWIMLTYFFVSMVLKQITKHHYFTRKLHAILFLCVLVFVVFNHFHLHITYQDVADQFGF
jgi:hypothetical protein